MIEMKNRLKDIKRYLWDVLLFSGIGCFSYFLLVYYADIPSQYQDRLMTFQAFSAVVVLFNGVGLSVKYINEKLMMYYQFFLKNHRMLSIGLITAAIILCFILAGFWKKVNVYDAFIEGAKEGFTTAVKIIPIQCRPTL